MRDERNALLAIGTSLGAGLIVVAFLAQAIGTPPIAVVTLVIVTGASLLPATLWGYRKWLNERRHGTGRGAISAKEWTLVGGVVILVSILLWVALYAWWHEARTWAIGAIVAAGVAGAYGRSLLRRIGDVAEISVDSRLRVPTIDQQFAVYRTVLRGCLPTVFAIATFLRGYSAMSAVLLGMQVALIPWIVARVRKHLASQG
jgi:hypothetical protein